MASPPITQNTVGSNPVTNMRAPTTLPHVASWLGRSPMTTVPYPQVSGLMWQGKGQGNFSLIEAVPPKDVRFSRGPRMSPSKGTLDVWVVAPTSGSIRYFLLLGSDDTTFLGADLGSFRLGVSATNRLTGSIRDETDTVVAAFTDATLFALVAGTTYHIQLSWDANQGVVEAAINGASINGGDYTTAPGAPWDPARPTRANLYKGTTAPAWNANIPLVQISSQFLL